MRRHIPKAVYLTPDQISALKIIKEKTKVPITELIRVGIDLALAKHSTEKTIMEEIGEEKCTTTY